MPKMNEMPSGGDIIKQVLIGLVGEEAVKQESKFWESQKPPIEHEGSRIVLPAEPGKMSYRAAREALARAEADENQMLQVNERIDAYPLDAAVAFLMAIQKTYGWASPVPTPGFFGPELPNMVTVRVGPELGETMQVPIGSFIVPNIENRIETRIGWDKAARRSFFSVHGEVRKKERTIIMELVELSREILRTNSIYKGKALHMRVSDTGDLIEGWQGPEFMSVKHVRPEELILSDNVMAQVEVSLLTPIKHTETCRRHSIPLKRGIALSGKYGTGKSLTASVCSRVCVENGWTFIMLDKVQGLKHALEFAKRYQPAVVFAEDIDRVISERDEDANSLLNTIDGVLGKNAEVITVLTTNHIDRITQAMLRPGRLDAVIEVTPPDAGAAERLIRLYGRGLVDESEPLGEAAAAVAGQIPATIREVVERAKLSMIAHGHSSVKQLDLIISADGMKTHLDLLNKPSDHIPSPEEAVGIAMRKLVEKAGGFASAEEIAHALQNSADSVRQSASKISDNIQMLSGEAMEASKRLQGDIVKIKKNTEAILANGHG